VYAALRCVSIANSRPRSNSTAPADAVIAAVMSRRSSVNSLEALSVLLLQRLDIL